MDDQERDLNEEPLMTMREQHIYKHIILITFNSSKVTLETLLEKYDGDGSGLSVVLRNLEDKGFISRTKMKTIHLDEFFPIKAGVDIPCGPGDALGLALSDWMKLWNQERPEVDDDLEDAMIPSASEVGDAYVPRDGDDHVWVEGELNSGNTTMFPTQDEDDDLDFEDNNDIYDGDVC